MTKHMQSLATATQSLPPIRRKSTIFTNLIKSCFAVMNVQIVDQVQIGKAEFAAWIARQA